MTKPKQSNPDMEKRESLIEMRAMGKSMDKIAEELHMSKSTVAKWIHELESAIKNRKYEEYEILLEKYNVSKQKRLETYTNLLEKALNELKDRDLKSLNVKDLLKFAEMIDNKIREEMKNFQYDTGEYEEQDFDDIFGEVNKTLKTIKIDY
jgi:transcriptional regulator with XRE-family HTH domain